MSTTFWNSFSIILNVLFDDQTDPSVYDNEEFRIASKNGNIDVVDRLLQDMRVDPSANDNEAI